VDVKDEEIRRKALMVDIKAGASEIATIIDAAIRLAREDEREALTKWHQEGYAEANRKSIESVDVQYLYHRNKGRMDAHSDAVDFISERGKP
jgi:hypothetical protein